MSTKLLKTGDIIRIEKGMEVIAQVPVNVFSKEKPFSKEYASAVVKIGEVYRSSPPSEKVILEKIDSFLKSELDVTLSNEELKKIVDKLQINYEVKTFDTSFLEGEYVVSKADLLYQRIAPYQVSCYKRYNPKIEIVFYQDCPVYRANISKEIEVIGNIDDK